MKNFKGQALFLDRSDINTDEIILAKYLTENTKEALRHHILEDLHLESFDAEKIIDKADFNNPDARPEGIHKVLVNGRVVVENNEYTAAKGYGRRH